MGSSSKEDGFATPVLRSRCIKRISIYFRCIFTEEYEKRVVENKKLRGTKENRTGLVRKSEGAVHVGSRKRHPSSVSSSAQLEILLHYRYDWATIEVRNHLSFSLQTTSEEEPNSNAVKR